MTTMTTVSFYKNEYFVRSSESTNECLLSSSGCSIDFYDANDNLFASVKYNEDIKEIPIYYDGKVFKYVDGEIEEIAY